MNNVVLELENALREVLDYATNNPQVDKLPVDTFTKVPEAFIKLYGSKLGREKWETFASACYRVFRANNDDLTLGIAEACKQIIAMYVEQLKYMYKARDGKDYVSFADAIAANNDYDMSLNPEKGRSR